MFSKSKNWTRRTKKGTKRRRSSHEALKMIECRQIMICKVRHWEGHSLPIMWIVAECYFLWYLYSPTPLFSLRSSLRPFWSHILARSPTSHGKPPTSSHGPPISPPGSNVRRFAGKAQTALRSPWLCQLFQFSQTSVSPSRPPQTLLQSWLIPPSPRHSKETIRKTPHSPFSPPTPGLLFPARPVSQDHTWYLLASIFSHEEEA